MTNKNQFELNLLLQLISAISSLNFGAVFWPRASRKYERHHHHHHHEDLVIARTFNAKQEISLQIPMTFYIYTGASKQNYKCTRRA